MLQTLASDESYRSSEPFSGDDHSQGFNFRHYFDVLKRRFFYFLLPFGLISVLGLYVAAIQKPSYLSEGKILVESPLAPDLVKLIATAPASERIQLIQQRILTRENLLSIANKFDLFPNQPRILDLMRKSALIKPADVEGQLRQGSATTAFTVSFEYETPELAMRVASELTTMIVNEDERSRTSRSTEAVKILTGETKEIRDKIEATQSQISDISRRPHETAAENLEQQKSQLNAYATLKAELIQKSSIYSDAHPAVVALKKRVAAMEKSMQSPKAPSTDADDLETLKRQREALEKSLADANDRLATARLNEQIDRDQQFGRVQVLETPALPQRPEKSGRLKLIGLAFVAAVVLGVGTAMATELLDGSIRGRHQLSGVVASPLIVSIPYIQIPADVTRARWRVVIGIFTLVLLLTVLGGLAAAIVLGLPVDFTLLERAASFRFG